ncbi:Na(+)/H(+) antiporter subunit B [Marinitoga lauensis]|uniref:Na(+)/H(+) antiporter subunit B n=1 Tax=Marinitoga lauensis TaxID=2201189 RepID=UPI001013119F|nr:hydrogenase subunit MbhD domain-containing protein [Marinitoga lauensis]
MQIIEIIVGIVLLIFAFLAIEAKKIINSVIYLSILSMLAVVSFVFMKAPDVAITEAVIGSGLVTAIFIFTLFSIKKVGDKK